MNSGSLSGSIINGQQFKAKVGSAAINAGDLLVLGGPGSQAFTAATIDYAKNAAVGTLASPISVATYVTGGGSRQQLARDAQGNIYTAGTNSSGNLVINKFSPLLGTTSSKIVDVTATSVNTPKLFQIQNGTYACVYARAAGALYFVIFDAALTLLAGPISIATEYAATNVVHHDAWPISGGGFGVTYQTSAGTAIDLATYSNTGGVVQAATSIQTLAGSAALQFLRSGQLPSGNIVCAYRGTMTAGGTAGTSFTISTTAGANVAGPTNMDSTSVAGFLDLNILASGFFGLAEANGTNLECAVYSQAGAIQGSVYSTANTLNSTTYPQVKLTNDGLQFWLSYFGSAANGLNVVQIPTSGATTGTAVTGLSSATLSASTYALDAEVINGLLTALAASSTTSGQYWLTVGLPDASQGINAPYLRTGATAIGSAAATTGSNWPRIISGGAGLYQGSNPPINQPLNVPTAGDWTAIVCYDQQNVTGTFIGVVKTEASSIIGIATGAVAVGNPGTSIAVNPGPGGYSINPISGSADTIFNHSFTGGVLGLFASNVGMQLGSQTAGGASGVTQGTNSSITTGTTAIGAGFLGVFGTGNYAIFPKSGAFTASYTGPHRVRVIGAGGGGAAQGCGGSGGGFAIKTVALSAGSSTAVTIGTAGAGGSSSSSVYTPGVAGGSSSFGIYVSATGGAGGTNTTATGGVGVGGDINASGGSSSNTGNGGAGGAGAGSQLGIGGSTVSSASCGGAAPGGWPVTTGGGGSPFGSPTSSGAPDITGIVAASSPGTLNTINASIRFPFDAFVSGGAGGGVGIPGGLFGGGGSGGSSGGPGGIGAGGGGAANSSTALGGAGGIGAGGGGAYSSVTGLVTGGNGGPGFLVVEW